MVDYVQLPVATTNGDQVASDEIAGLKFQRVKMIIGADGVNDGDVSSSNPLPVEIQGALGTADTKALGSPLVSGDIGLVTNTVIHGITTGGGGGYVDVKVNPSGSLVVDASGSVVALDAATLAALETINANTGGLTDTQLRASAVPVSLASVPLPTGAATDVTLVAIQDLNDTLLTLLSAIFEKMPRVTGTDQAAVSVENAPNITTVSTVSNQTQIGGQEALTTARSQIMAGTQHIYSNITVA